MKEHLARLVVLTFPTLAFAVLESHAVLAEETTVVDTEKAASKSVQQLNEQLSETKNELDKTKSELIKATAAALANQYLMNEEANKRFGGLNWGAGVSLTVSLGSKTRVKSASVINGIVRIDSKNNAVARVILETHYFFTPDTFFGADSILGVKNDQNTPSQPGLKRWGIGPFIALQPGTDQIIDAIGAGIMMGFKRDSSDENASWNFGIGVIVDPNVQVLGDGIVANQPLPAGETEIRYKTVARAGVLFLFSATF